MKKRLNLQTVLSVSAIALAAVTLIRTGAMNFDGASAAFAAPPETFVDSGEQRQEMIAELRQLNVRLARLERALDSGLTVRVVEPDGN